MLCWSTELKLVQKLKQFTTFIHQFQYTHHTQWGGGGWVQVLTVYKHYITIIHKRVSGELVQLYTTPLLLLKRHSGCRLHKLPVRELIQCWVSTPATIITCIPETLITHKSTQWKVTNVLKIASTD